MLTSLLPIPNYPLPITHYQFPITHYPLPITKYATLVWFFKFRTSRRSGVSHEEIHLGGGLTRIGVKICQ
ncbi:hypothetical protein CBP16_00425 [Fischerella thermalis WC217]|nr:hypothetical protein CBP16_00425 [Fischerella thermalis WC217]